MNNCLAILIFYYHFINWNLLEWKMKIMNVIHIIMMFNRIWKNKIIFQGSRVWLSRDIINTFLTVVIFNRNFNKLLPNQFINNVNHLELVTRCILFNNTIDPNCILTRSSQPPKWLHRYPKRFAIITTKEIMKTKVIIWTKVIMKWMKL